MKTADITEPENDLYRVVIRRGDYDDKTLLRLSKVLKRPVDQLRQKLEKTHLVVRSNAPKSQAIAIQQSFSRAGFSTALVPQMEPSTRADEHDAQVVRHPGADRPTPNSSSAAAGGVAPASRSRSKVDFLRSPLVLGFAGLIVVLLAGFGGYRYWLTTPSYAAQQIVHSIEDNDVRTFVDRVDLLMVTSAYISQFAPFILYPERFDQPPIKDAGVPLRVSPTVYRAVEDGILRFVETGSLAGAANPTARQALERAIPISLRSLRFGRPEIEVTGNSAVLRANISSPIVGFDGVVEARLVNEGGWRLVELVNGGELAADIHRAELQILPALNESLKDELAREIAAVRMEVVATRPSDPNSDLVVTGEFAIPDGKKLLRTHGEIYLSDSSASQEPLTIPFLWRQAGPFENGKTPAFSVMLPNTPEARAFRELARTAPSLLSFNARLHGLQFDGEPPRYTARSVQEFVQMRNAFDEAVSN